MATKQFPQVPSQRRERIGSRYANRLRQAGRLPAVVYGHGQEPLHLSVDRKEIVNLLHSNAHIIELTLDAQKQPVLIKDVQWDHLGAQVVHLDLERVDLTERITVEVPLVLFGEAVGLKEEGAILEHPLTALEIECLAMEIPDEIKVDVAELKVGDTILVGDLKLPSGIATKLDPETLVAGVSMVKEEVVEVAPVEGATAEPEIIGRKPEEGEEGAAAAAPAAGEKKAPEKKAPEKK